MILGGYFVSLTSTGVSKYYRKQRDTVVVYFTCVAGHSGARVMKSGLNWEDAQALIRVGAIYLWHCPLSRVSGRPASPC